MPSNTCRELLQGRPRRSARTGKGDNRGSITFHWSSVRCMDRYRPQDGTPVELLSSTFINQSDRRYCGI